jgi:hypothetical protein
MNRLLNKKPQERPDAKTILCMKEIEPIKKKIFAQVKKVDQENGWKLEK